MKNFAWLIPAVVALALGSGYAAAQGHHGGSGGGHAGAGGWHGGGSSGWQGGGSNGWQGGGRGNWSSGAMTGGNWRGGNWSRGGWGAAAWNGHGGYHGGWHGGYHGGHGYYHGGHGYGGWGYPSYYFGFGIPFYYPWYYTAPAYPAYAEAAPPVYIERPPAYVEPPPPAEAPPPAPAPQALPTPDRLESFTLSATELFEFDRATLRLPQPKLDEIASVLIRNPQVKNIRIIGYTDRIGTDPYNVRLSQRRAEAVKNYLVTKGVASTRLIAVGRGKADPLVQCPGKMSQAQLIKCLEPNRRVVIEPVTVERRVRPNEM